MPAPKRQKPGKISPIQQEAPTDSVDTKTSVAQSINCARSEPEEVLDRNHFENWSFQRKSTYSAVEKVDLLGNDELIIYHGGCESFVLNFVFKIDRPSSDDADIHYWYHRVISSLKGLEGHCDPFLNLAKVTLAMDKYLFSSSEPKLGEEIVAYGDEIPASVSFDSVEQLKDKRWRLSDTFAIGPL